MPRNGSGIYSLPSGYLAETGELIIADQHNGPLEDVRDDLNAARPIVAGGTGATTASGARTALSVPSIAALESGYVPKVASKTALSALDTASFKAAVVTEDTREKLWMWKTGDFSAEEAADTENVNYIAADGVSTALGCWVAATGDGVAVRPISGGGTGASTAEDARTNLGLGSSAVAALIDDDTFATATSSNIPSAESVKAYADTKQPLNANLTTLAESPLAAREYLELPNVWTLTTTGTAAELITAIDAGQCIFINTDVTGVTLTTEAQVQSLAAAMDRITVLGPLLTINLPSGQHDISAAVYASSPKIKLVGATPVSTTISSIASVSGSAGAWTVVANLADATGIEIGDVLKITGVTPGVQAPGTYTGQPPRGALQMQFFQNGELSLAGTTGTVTGSVLTTYVSSGDFLIADGRVKRMLSITTSGFAIDAANTPPKDYSGKQYWYTMRPSASGTVTVNGTTVTGTSTGFTSLVNAGDLIAFQGYGIRKVASVDSDTQLTLTASHPTIASGVVWGVIVAGELHEGAWVVTNVSGNQVTWVNTAKTAYGPPTRLVNGGAVTALKTVLEFSGTSGFIVDDCTLEMDQIGLTGSGGSATVAIDLRGVGSQRSGQASLGDNVGVNGFHYGSRTPTGGALYAGGTCWSNQTTRAHDFAEAGYGYLNNAVVAGSGGIGVFLGAGCYVRLASARIHGHTLQGVRQEVGSSTWADFAIIGHCLQANILVVGGAHTHLVGVRSFCGAADALNLQNGAYGRGTGFAAIGNADDGVDGASGHMEMNQILALGNGDDGAVMSRGNLAVEEGAFGFNGGKGLYALTNAHVEAGTAQFIGNVDGIVATARARVYAPNTGFDDNTGQDCEALTGGFIDITGHGGATVFIPATLNMRGADESLVTDGDLQGAAVADATDNASAITQLNALLAGLRAQGHIAT